MGTMSVPTIFIYRGIQYGLYDCLKANALFQGFLFQFILSLTTTITANAAMYPLNTLRARLVMTTGESKGYNGWVDQMRYIIRKEGALVLYKGFVANCGKN